MWSARSTVLLLTGLALVSEAVRADSRELPFDFLHNQVVLRVAINGAGPYNFILDTGTYASTIDLGLAKKLRLKLSEPRAKSRGAGSRHVTGRVTTIEELRVSESEVVRLDAAALDLSHIARELGNPLHGVLGSNFLESRITQIDYLRRRIRFLSEPPARMPDSPRRITFPMRFSSGSVLPLLEDCHINGRRLPVSIDTGSSLGLVLFREAIVLLGLEDLAREGIPLGAAGYRGRARLTKGWLRSVQLGGIDLGAIQVAYVRSGYGDENSADERAGNLGNAVLQDFVLTLDYCHKTVTLENVAD
jgi:hypothetical protein